MLFNNFIWLFLLYFIGIDSGMCFNVKIYFCVIWGVRYFKSVIIMYILVSFFFVYYIEGSFCYDFIFCVV